MQVKPLILQVVHIHSVAWASITLRMASYDALTWYVQESLDEKTIFDAVGTSNNVKISAHGCVAVASKSKIHIFNAYGHHMHFFSSEFLSISPRASTDAVGETVTSPMEWLQMKNTAAPSWIIDFQWLKSILKPFSTWNVLVLLSDGDLLSLRCQGSPAVPSPTRRGSSDFYEYSDERGIEWSFKASSQYSSFGPVKCFGVTTNDAGSIVTVHDSTLVRWQRQSDGSFQPTIALSPHDLPVLHLYGVVAIGSHYDEVSQSLCIVCCYVEGEALLLHWPAQALPVVVRRIRFFGRLISSLFDRGEYTLVTSVSVVRGTFDNAAFTATDTGGAGATDASAIWSCNADVTALCRPRCFAGPHDNDTAIAALETGELRLVSLSDAAGRSHVRQAWTSTRGIFGIYGVAVDELSALVFCTWKIPPHLSNSREVQLRRDLRRPGLVLRALLSPFDLPRRWLFTWSERTWYMHSLLQRMREGAGDSPQTAIFALLRVLLTMGDWRETVGLSASPEVVFPRALADAHEILRRVGEDDPQNTEDAHLLNSFRAAFYEADDGADDAGNDDDGDSDGDNDVTRTPTSQKARSSGGSASKRQAASAAGQPPGFALQAMYSELQRHLRPDPRRLAHIVLFNVLRSAELLSQLPPASHQQSAPIHNQAELLTQIHALVPVAALQALIAADNSDAPFRLHHTLSVAAYDDAQFDDDVLLRAALLQHLHRLQLLHMWLHGVCTALDIDDDALDVALREAKAQLRLRIVHIRGLLLLLLDESHGSDASSSLSLLRSRVVSILRAADIASSAVVCRVLQRRPVDAPPPNAELCGICCTSSLAWDALSIFFAPCSACDIAVDRCCVTFATITAPTAAVDTDVSSSQVLRCALCKAVSRWDLFASFAVEAVIDGTETAAFCPFCHVAMQPM